MLYFFWLCLLIFILSTKRNKEIFLSKFDDAINYVLNNEMTHEEHLSNDKDDPGGLTNYGLSIKFIKSMTPERLKSYGIIIVDEDHLIQIIKEMDIETAKCIYKGQFWNDTHFEDIHSQFVTNYYFDTAVNCGMATATKMIQRAIHATNVKTNIIDDGVFGLMTLEEINRIDYAILSSFRSERSSYYRNLVSNNVHLSKYLKGWLDRAYK